MHIVAPAAGAILVLSLASGPAPARAAEAGPLLALVGAPEGLKLSGSFRARYEALDGQFRPGAIPTEHLVSLRTLVAAEYGTGPVRVGAELQDSRVYAAQAGGAVSTSEVNALELVQAYVAGNLKDPFGPGTAATLQAGRFTMNLGSRRLVAGDDYRNTINAFTGLRFDARAADGASATLVYTLPQVRRPDDQPALLRNQVVFDRESFDLTFWGGLVTKPGLPGKTVFDAAFFGLDERDAPRRPNRERRLRTVSARIIRNPVPGRFDFEAEAAYQFGSIRSSAQPGTPRLDVSASFLHLDAGYQFAGGWKPRVSVEYDRVSGDDGKASYGRFDTLFGMRGADFAPSGIYAAIGRANISTPGLRLEATPPRAEAYVVYRGLWAASATDSFSTTGVRDPTGASGRYAGQQVEARVRYWLKPAVLRLDLSGAVLFKRGVLERAPNAPRTGDTHYGAAALSAFF